MTVFYITIGLLLVLSIPLLCGKGAFMIAGFNTMSREEKAKYNEKALARFVGLMIIATAVCMALVPIGWSLGIDWLGYCGIILMIVIPIGGVIYANTGGRFRGKDGSEFSEADKEKKPMKAAARGGIVALVGFCAVILIGVGIIMFRGAAEPEVYVFENGIQISGMYGLTEEFSAITGITLIDRPMKEISSAKRTNGYGGLGEALKGNFSSGEYGEILLFVQSETAPTIHIERSGGRGIFISFRDSEKTVELYNEMTAAFP